MRLWRDRHGYAMTFWAIFIGVVMIPILALAIELGRYFYAIAEVQKAADAAAVAASVENDPQVFQDTGSLVPTSTTWHCLPHHLPPLADRMISPAPGKGFTACRGSPRHFLDLSVKIEKTLLGGIWIKCCRA